MMRIALLTMVCALGSADVARAQSAAQPSSSNGGWNVAVYPILVWVPISIGIDVEVPPVNGGGGGETGDIIDSRFDGAFLGGVTASNGTWLIDAYGIWAGFGGDRPDRPFLRVDVDLIYGEGKVGRSVGRDFYITGGVRRLALDYDITIADLPTLSRKPGLWDPIVGVAWHRVGPKVEWHASFEGGGFGVGADVDLSAAIRADWKPIPHFGFTAGYSILYLKVTDDVRERTVTIKPTLHGPAVGIGFYF